jgi:hypothetical protein
MGEKTHPNSKAFVILIQNCRFADLHAFLKDLHPKIKKSNDYKRLLEISMIKFAAYK